MTPAEPQGETLEHRTPGPAGHTAGQPTTATPQTLPHPGGPVRPPLPALPGYEVLGEVGRGGMGVVYRAKQLGLNRVVAVKMILAGEYAAESILERFRAEAEAVAAVQHPNIVQVYDSGLHNGLPYFSMEYCAAGNLAARLRDAAPAPAEAARVVEAVARAVAAAHAKGIIHRDLKPANVLLADDGTPKVADFGLAKWVDEGQSVTGTSAILGTPSYMAPEQARGAKSIGPAADIYALGAILYECLTGRPPFKGDSVLETLDMVRTQPPPAVRSIRRDVPRDLAALCHQCLEKLPSDRYASAQALADDLARFGRGEPLRAKGVALSTRLYRAVSRANGWPAGVAVAAALLAVWASRQEHSPTQPSAPPDSVAIRSGDGPSSRPLPPPGDSLKPPPAPKADLEGDVPLTGGVDVGDFKPPSSPPVPKAVRGDDVRGLPERVGGEVNPSSAPALPPNSLPAQPPALDRLFEDVEQGRRRAKPQPLAQALVVGVNDYGDTVFTNLRYAENDVALWVRCLRHSGYDAKHVTALKSRAATKDRIQAELLKMATAAGKDDVLVFAFSGHGLHFAGDDDPKMVPCDGRMNDRQSFVSVKGAIDALGKSKAKAAYLFLDVARDDPERYGRSPPPLGELKSASRPVVLIVPGGVACMVSTWSGGRAYESTATKSGLFTYVVLNGWMGKALPKEQGPVDFMSLAGYVGTEMPALAQQLLDKSAIQRPYVFGGQPGMPPLVEWLPPDAKR